MMLAAQQVRAARAMLRWDQKELAAAAGVSIETIKRIEGQDGEIAANSATLSAVRRALEAAGVEIEKIPRGVAEPCVAHKRFLCPACSPRALNEVVNLGASRAVAAQDSTKWTPVECLRFILAEIEAGRIAPDRMIVAGLQTKDSREQPVLYAAGITYAETSLLLDLTRQMHIDKILGRR